MKRRKPKQPKPCKRQPRKGRLCCSIRGCRALTDGGMFCDKHRCTKPRPPKLNMRDEYLSCEDLGEGSSGHFISSVPERSVVDQLGRTKRVENVKKALDVNLERIMDEVRSVPILRAGVDVLDPHTRRRLESAIRCVLAEMWDA